MFQPFQNNLSSLPFRDQHHGLHFACLWKQPCSCCSDSHSSSYYLLSSDALLLSKYDFQNKALLEHG